MITTAQAADIIKARRLIVEPVDGGWRAQTKERTRLHKGAKPTYEEAVEAALLTLTEAESARVRTDKSRLFDLLGTGKVRFEYREETIPGEGVVMMFDIYDAKGVRIINGAASLHEAVLEADALGAFSTPSVPAPPSVPPSVSPPAPKGTP